MDDGADNNFPKNDADSIDDSVSRSSSNSRDDEEGEIENSILWHELSLEDSVDDFGTTKRLCLNAKGEQWLHIRDSPDHRVKDYIEKQDVATATSLKSSQNFTEGDEKKEGDLSSQGKRDTEKANQAKTAFETIMQTQEPSPSQKTLTQFYTEVQTQLQTQYQTQTQETITQQSAPTMSLLEYLNQPTQDLNETATVNVGIGSCIEILSGKELSSLYSGSSSLPSSPQYPPNDSAFLCFEEVTPIGLEQKSYMTVKDMRLPHNATNNPYTCEEEIDLARRSENASIEWKPLSRRELTILYPGDRLRIRTKASDSLKTAVSIDPAISLLRNTSITLTYGRRKTSSSIRNNQSVSQIVETKNIDAEIGGEINIEDDMNVDDESQVSDNDIVPEAKNLNSWDKDLNTFVGTTKKRAKAVPRVGDALSHRSISSPMVDSSLSIGIDSTVNTQQESLRSYRMKLLNRNLSHSNDLELNEEENNNARATNDSSLQSETIVIDKKKEISCQVEIDTAKNADDNNRVDDASSESTVLNDNHQELGSDDVKSNPKESEDNVPNEPAPSNEKDENATTQEYKHMEANDSTAGKNSCHDQRDDPSIATRDSAATLLLTQTQKLDSVRSDDSATILMTQEADFAALNKNNTDRDKSEGLQRKVCLDHHTGTEAFDEILSKHSIEDTETIPRNIEIGNNEQEDRPPISQLLLSMETDNEYDDDRKDEKLTLAAQEVNACRATAKRPPSEEALSKNIENDANLTSSLTTEKPENESGVNERIGVKSTAPSIEQNRTEPNEIVSVSREDAGRCEGNKNIQKENDAIDKVTEESDDETILGAVVMMHNPLTSSSSNGSRMDIHENQNDCQELDNRSKSLNQDNVLQGQTSPTEQEDDISKKQCEVDRKETSDIEMTDQRVHNGKTNLSSVSSSGNKDQSKTNALQTKKRKFATADKSSTVLLEPCKITNEDTNEGTSAHSSSANKRRRTRNSTRESSRNKSTSVVARAADELYRKRFNAAIDNNVINIVVSGFEENELVHISKLCKTKFSNVKKLKISDTVDERTTTCILQTVSNDIDEASCRTFKAIQCSLLGIPIVSLLWLEQCKEDQKVKIPERYVRTLSSNIGGLRMRDQARYGVARLAATRCGEPQNPCLLFENTSVFLCGKYSSEKRKNITKLLKDGSAKIITSSREALVKLESVTEESSDNVLVLLVGDGGIPIPKSLQKEVLAALQIAKSRTIYIVDSNWVSLSIVCGGILSPANFKPKCSEDLWRLSKELPEN